MRKNVERDKAAGQALVAWMKENGYTDGRLAKEIGRSAAAVATWRGGTRPMGREREVLQKMTGINWDNPSDLSEILPPEPSVNGTTKVVTRRRKKAARVPDRALEHGSLEGILVARERVTAALRDGTPLDPSDPHDKLALSICGEALDLEVTRREKDDAKYRAASALRQLIVGHNDPREAIRFVREHANFDPEVVAAVERSLALATGAENRQPAHA